jgi:hypothetical protein
MRQAKSGMRLSTRAFIGLVMVVALVAPAWAYINGGDFHTTLRTFEKSLKATGWGVSFGTPIPAERDDVNQLVARALQSLPETDRGTISVEAKREVARLTREAIQHAVKNKQQTIKKGQTGSLQYQVGVYEFESYWETNYGGKREIHARRTGLVPFVALKVVDRTDRPGQQSERPR